MTHKSCLTCAYNTRGKKELDEVYSDTRWCGYTAKCQRQIWTVGYEISPDTNILEDAHNRGWDGSHQAGYLEKSIEKLKQEFPEDFDLTKVPLSDRKWHDLAKYKCRHYYPEKKRGAMSRKKCWEEHQQRKQDLRFWIPILVSGSAIFIAIISLWRSW